MSATVKSLQQAVHDEIDHLVQNGVEFSAWEVTKLIREKINHGELEIDTIDFTVVDGIKTQYIDHDDVRFIVHSYCDDASCSIAVSLDILDLGYEKKWNKFKDLRPGGYYSWGPINDDDDVTQPFSGIVQGIGCTGTGTVITLATQVTPGKFPPGDPSNPVLIEKVLKYFSKGVCQQKPRTLHGAQKRMKRNPLTIDQIKTIAMNNGYVLRRTGKSAECDSNVVPRPRTSRSKTVGRVRRV